MPLDIRALSFPIVAAWAAHLVPHVVILKPERVGAPEAAAAIRAIPADAWVVIAFGQKLPSALLAGVFAINLHASLLPRWRGAAPIHAAILAADAVTGNSVITLADQVDAGLVLAQSRREIDPGETAGELHNTLAADGPELVLRVLADHQRGRLSPVRQDESRVTLAPKLRKEDGVVDFSAPADDCRRRIHALTPWPGVAVTIAGERVKLLRVVPEQADGPATPAPGVLADAQRGLVACGGGTALRLLQVLPAGARAMRWDEFARGRPGLAGTCLGPPS